MPIFSAVYLNELLEEAEKEISNRVHCIVKRTAIAITANQSTYTLANDVIGIIRLTWKGDKLDPAEFSDFDFSSYIKPNNLGAVGKPKWYIRTGYGYDDIMLYPVPNVAVAATATTEGADIEAGVILTAYHATDLSSNRLPVYLRRNIMKYFALARAYAREGIGQNLQASQYFYQRYTQFLTMYKSVIQSIPKAVELQFGEGRTDSLKPARPSLPSGSKWSF